MDKKLFYGGLGLQIPNVVIAVGYGILLINWDINLVVKVIAGSVYGIVNDLRYTRFRIPHGHYERNCLLPFL